MKILSPSSNKNCEGSALIVSVVITGIIGFSLAGYLDYAKAQNRSVMRSLAWNSTVAVLEAGIEEALAQINAAVLGTEDERSRYGRNGWDRDDSAGVYRRTRSLESGYYTVSFTTTKPPTITATGYAKVPLTSSSVLNRTVVCTTTSDFLFTKGIVAKGVIDMNGNNVQTDSFDSATATGGVYSAGAAKSGGDVATNAGVANALNVGQADIYGHGATGPGGSISVGANGGVGERAWVLANQGKMQPGWTTSDMNVSFPDVSAPFSGGYSTPAGGTVGTTAYTYVLNSGNYQLSSVSLSGTSKVYVSGAAVWYVTGNFSMSGQSQIILATGASLKLFVAGASTSLGGKGVVNNSGKADNFSYWGLPTNTSLSMSGNAAFIGTIYAPSAAFTLAGGGNTTTDFIGASVTGSVRMLGHFNFHYDELLGRQGASRGYIVNSWNEI